VAWKEDSLKGKQPKSKITQEKNEAEMAKSRSKGVNEEGDRVKGGRKLEGGRWG